MRPAIFAPLLLGACASTPVDPPSPTETVSASDPCAQRCPVIIQEVTSWGRTIGSLYLGSDGLALRRSIDFRSGEEISSNRFRLTPEQHRRAVRAIEVLRTHLPRSVNCGGVPTDGPSGSFTWDGGQRFDVYYACYGQLPALGRRGRCLLGSHQRG